MSSDADSVKPIKSRYEANPWEPTIDTKDGNQKKAGQDYTDVYGGTVTDGTSDKKDDGKTENEKSGRDPILKAAYTTAPDFVPAAEIPDYEQDTTKPPPAMESGEFSVQLASLHTAEQSCLDATSAMIAGYDTLKAVVDKAATDPDYFGQQAGHWENVQGNSYAAWTEQWQGDQYDEEAQEFADAIVPQMKNLLNSIGNSVEACGQFNALLNNAGQIYATLDRNAEFKDS